MKSFPFPDDMMTYLKYTIYGTRTHLELKDIAEILEDKNPTAFLYINH